MLKGTAYGTSSSSYSRPVSLAESSTQWATSSLFPAGTIFEGQRKHAEHERRSNVLAASVPYASSPLEAPRERKSQALESNQDGTDGHVKGARSAAALDFTLSNSTHVASAVRKGATSQMKGGKAVPALSTLSLSARVYLRLCLGKTQLTSRT